MDRLLMVTSGISWHREDTKSLRPNREDFKNLRGRGDVCLVYWMPPEKTGQKSGIWVTLGGTIGPQDFAFWCEFENPVDMRGLPPGYVSSVVVPDVDDLVPQAGTVFR